MLEAPACTGHSDGEGGGVSEFRVWRLAGLSGSSSLCYMKVSYSWFSLYLADLSDPYLQ